MGTSCFLRQSLHKCMVIVSIFVTFTLAHTTPLYVKKFVSHNRITTPRHRKSSHNRVDAKEGLKILREQNPYNQPCIPDFVTDHDASRIPADLPHMPCPKGSGDRCVEIQLPMHVSFYTSLGDADNDNQGNLETKLIYIPSGCHENKKQDRPLKQNQSITKSKNESKSKKGVT